MSRLTKKQVHTNWNLVLRDNSTDLHTMKENDYEECEFLPDDVWLDAGANIGTFPLKYSNLVDKIISVEPDQENFQIIEQHLELNGIENCIPIQRALVGDDRKSIEFYAATGQMKSMHTTIPVRGRPKTSVPAININTILEEHGVTKIKMDIEGGELDLIHNIRDWSPIKEFIFEYHIAALKDRTLIKLESVKDILKDAGFKTVSETPLLMWGDERLRILHYRK